MFTQDELKQLQEVISTELKPVKKDITDLKKFAKRTDKKLKQIHNDQNTIIDMFDNRDLERQKEIKQLQDFVRLPKAS